MFSPGCQLSFILTIVRFDCVGSLLEQGKGKLSRESISLAPSVHLLLLFSIWFNGNELCLQIYQIALEYR